MKTIKSGHVLMGENRTKNISQYAVSEDGYSCGFGRFIVQPVRKLLSRWLKTFKNEKFYIEVHAVCK